MSRPVVVTTAHRGVFFGFLSADQDESARSLILTDCRNVIYWSGTRGFLGLSSHGPEEGSRIGSTAPRVLLHDVTSVADCTDEAAERWRSFE